METEIKVMSDTKSNLVVKDNEIIVLDIEVNIKDIGGKKVNSINARDLHERLEVKDKFATWLDRRIKKYGLQRNGLHDFKRLSA